MLLLSVLRNDSDIELIYYSTRLAVFGLLYSNCTNVNLQDTRMICYSNSLHDSAKYVNLLEFEQLFQSTVHLSCNSKVLVYNKLNKEIQDTRAPT